MGRTAEHAPSSTLISCSNKQIFSTSKRLFLLRNIVPTLAIVIEKCLGTVNMCFYNV